LPLVGASSQLGLMILIFGGFATLCWKLIGRLRDEIAVDKTGIWRLPPKGQSVYIAWNDVGVVRADETTQRLIVSDRLRTHTIRLEYQLGNFSALRDHVLQHTAPATRAKKTSGAVFYRTWINKGILLFFFLCIVALGATSFATGHHAISAFVFGLAGLILGFVARDPMSVTIESDRVVIRYPGWKRDITFSDISSVALKDVSDRGNVWAVVVISLKHQKPIELYRFRDGSLALLQALQSALGPAPPPGEITQVV
jgi:hypothetical protein